MFITDKKSEIWTNVCGGSGNVIVEHFLDEKLMGDALDTYAKVTLKPGCSLGNHIHDEDSETIIVLSGNPEYDDNGTPRILHAGDVVHCPKGERHGIGNNAQAKEDVKLIALIIKK